MSKNSKNAAEPEATVELEESAGAMLLKVGGAWRLTGSVPQVEEVMPPEAESRTVRVAPANLADWDSSLPLFLLRVSSWCAQRNANLDLDGLPDALQRLFKFIQENKERQDNLEKPPSREKHTFAGFFQKKITHWKSGIRFVGECALGTLEVPTEPRHFSWKDFFLEMVEAGPKALPTIGLLSFLTVGTFAFETILQLRTFGAQIYVIAGVGLTVFREVGPMIAALVLAGRTGSAYAARIGDMKLNGEIDALEVLGVSPVNFLVLPRLAALVLVMPMIVLYADFLGILGGFVVTISMLNIPAAEYWVHLQSDVSLTDLTVGVVKGVVFGLLIGIAGTRRGLQAESTSSGVGRAVTSAVVTGITAIIIADALFAPILKNLGLGTR